MFTGSPLVVTMGESGANHMVELPFAVLAVTGVKPSLNVLLKMMSPFARSVRMPGACFGP